MKRKEISKRKYFGMAVILSVFLGLIASLIGNYTTLFITHQGSDYLFIWLWCFSTFCIGAFVSQNWLNEYFTIKQ